jgi:hypothetical protein
MELELPAVATAAAMGKFVSVVLSSVGAAMTRPSYHETAQVRPATWDVVGCRACSTSWC